MWFWRQIARLPVLSVVRKGVKVGLFWPQSERSLSRVAAQGAFGGGVLYTDLTGFPSRQGQSGEPKT